MSEQIVYIVDDDVSVLDSLSLLLRSVDLKSKTYSTAEDFIDSYTPDHTGCLLLDIQMPGISGLELLEKLRQLNINIPTIIITGHGNVVTAVKAMKNGAVDFLEKPYRAREIIEKIENAFSLNSAANPGSDIDKYHFHELFSGLTEREKEVFHEMIKGITNKHIARKLDISSRTVEVHRARVMEKLRSNNLPEIIRMAVISGLL